MAKYVWLYKGYPNENGMVWINTVMGEFQSNVTIDPIPTSNDPVTYVERLFFGEYLVTLRDRNGKILEQNVESVQHSTDCDYYGPENLVIGGDFDDGRIDPSFIALSGKLEIHWDGYIKGNVIRII